MIDIWYSGSNKLCFTKVIPSKDVLDFAFMWTIYNTYRYREDGIALYSTSEHTLFKLTSCFSNSPLRCL